MWCAKALVSIIGVITVIVMIPVVIVADVVQFLACGFSCDSNRDC
jgi:hypothetical protein